MNRRPKSRIHAGLTRERALVGTPYLGDRSLRADYEREIAPRTRAALQRIFAQVGDRWGQVGRVLDLGAGTGAASAAMRERFPGVEVTSVDRVAAVAGVVVADLRREVRPRGVVGRFDLIVAAHLLNELSGSMTVVERAAMVFAWARELLAEGGRIVLVEPALRETTRDLLAIRDRLVAAHFQVLAPCFWQGACPALERERDWCHDSAPWLQEPDGGSARGRSRVDFAYLVLRQGLPGDDRVDDKRLFRVVSDPIVEKGRLRLYGCGPAGRHALVRLDREESDENRDFSQAGRGDVIVVTGTERAGDGLRIGGGSRVERR